MRKDAGKTHAASAGYLFPDVARVCLECREKEPRCGAFGCQRYREACRRHRTRRKRGTGDEERIAASLRSSQ